MANKSFTGSVSNDWGTAGNWNTGSVPTSGDIATISGFAISFATGYTITGVAITVNGTTSFTASSLTLASGSTLSTTPAPLTTAFTWNASGTTTMAGTLTNNASNGVATKTMTLTGSGTFVFATGAIVNDYSTLTLSGASFTNSGTINLLNTGTMTVNSSFTGSGTVSIGATAKLTNAFSNDTINVTFAASGAEYDIASTVTGGSGLLTGLTVGGKIVFLGKNVTSVTVNPGSMSVDGFNFTTDGTFTSASQVTLSYDGTNTTLTAVCFLAGTRIATPDGERAIEDLAIGDLVTTASGEARAIKWIGRRGYNRRLAQANRGVHPVLFTAGSLGGGLPARDLMVSAQHAMFIDGVLVPAECLIDGVGIRRVLPQADLSYINIELETHDVILAEGTPSETFLDDDSRAIFHNAAEFYALYPQDADRDAEFCAPRVDAGPVLEQVRRQVVSRVAA